MTARALLNLVTCSVIATGFGLIMQNIVFARLPVSLSQRIRLGRSLYKANECSACHIVGNEGCRQGVRLDVTRRSKSFILSQLKDPDAHVQKNKSVFNGEPNLMPNPNLSGEEASAIADYLMSLTKAKTKPASKSNRPRGR